MKYDKDITLCTIQRSEGNTFNSKRVNKGVGGLAFAETVSVGTDSKEGRMCMAKEF